ncbi:MAG TPA: hypothetical protein VHQ21_01440, partial [Rhodanobacteraceae bacterium]|nr:hypothetical protein [Rhodanobacteraceae bacterium]
GAEMTTDNEQMPSYHELLAQRDELAQALRAILADAEDEDETGWACPAIAGIARAALAKLDAPK